MKNPSKRFGVIVGISNYGQVAANNNLRFTVNDAERLYSVLGSKAGFAEDTLQLLVDTPSEEYKSKAQMPSRSNILSAVNQFAEAASESDVLLVFFAGHGVEVGSHPYLLSNDTKMDVVRDTAVDIATLNNYLEKSKARCTLRIFDACRSGFSEARLLNPTMTRGLEQALLQTSKGWATFSACSTGECAYEHPDFKQGVFTYYLCEGLRGAAANAEGIVTWERLIDYVKISVANFCKSQSWLQTPHSVVDLSGALEIVKVEGASAPVEATEPPATVSPTKALNSEFRALLDFHLSVVAPTVRRYQLTKKEETPAIGELMNNALLGQLADFSHPSMQVELSSLDNFYSWGGPREKIQKTMEDAATTDDFSNDAQWLKVTFISSELSLPTSKLTVAAVRFKFFYWIWYWHECFPNQKSVEWTPEPNEKSGYFTFNPSAAMEVSEVEDVIHQILRTALQNIAEWANQSREFCERWVQKVSKPGLESV